MIQTIESRLVGELNPHERSVLRHGATWFFLILLGYYILRPIREQIGATYGVKNLSWLFWGTFVTMLIAIPIYSVLVGRYSRRILVPTIYTIFIGSLLGFWFALTGLSEAMQIWVARAFFIWISVFGLFVVSFFWSVVGDLLSTEQGRRIFGVMMGAGTVGGMVGSQLASRLVSVMGVGNLLLIPAGLLTIGLFVYLSLEQAHQRYSAKVTTSETGKPTGGNPFAGFTAVFKSRYLFAIFLFGGLMALCATSVYFQQSEIVRSSFENAPIDESRIEETANRLAQERTGPSTVKTEADILAAKKVLQLKASQEASTEYFANINFAVSVVTLLFQFFVAGWLMRTIGIGWTLAVLPMAYVVAIVSLALSPTLFVLAIISTLGRAAEYGICNPAREVLFTAVSREDRYKAKSFIDTVVRRGGDSAAGSIYQFLRESAGFAMTTLSWAMIPFALLWVGLSVFIGRENRQLIGNQESKSNSSSSSK